MSKITLVPLLARDRDTFKINVSEAVRAPLAKAISDVIRPMRTMQVATALGTNFERAKRYSLAAKNDNGMGIPFDELLWMALRLNIAVSISYDVKQGLDSRSLHGQRREFWNRACERGEEPLSDVRDVAATDTPSVAGCAIPVCDQGNLRPLQHDVVGGDAAKRDCEHDTPAH